MDIGLVQWTPYTKYTDWIVTQGYTDPSTFDANVYRINYEVENNVQWGNDVYSNPPPYNFEGFTKSTKSAYDLAIEFLRYYEKPADYDQPIRGTHANYWYDYLLNNPPVPPSYNIKKKKFKWVLYSQKLRNKKIIY